MDKQVILTAIAEQDLDQISSYLIDNWGNAVCEEFLLRFEQLCDLLSSAPGIFPVIHKKNKIRKCTLTRQNTIYYRDTRIKSRSLRFLTQDKILTS